MTTLLGNIPANTDMESFAATYGGGGGSSGTGWFDLSVFTRSTVAATDQILIGDVSDPTVDPSGTLKKISLPGLAEVQRRLLTNSSATDQGPGFTADTYLTGSNVIIPDTPVAGSSFRFLTQIVKTAAGTGIPTFVIRTGSAATTADTSRATLTFAAGTAAADTAFLEIIGIVNQVDATNINIRVGARAVTNLASTGWSNGIKSVVTTSGSFAASTLAGLNIGVSYSGGASASHTVRFTRMEWIP